MLVLSRKKNEAIVVGDDIRIVVVEIRGDKVRLGIKATRSVPVHREEIYQTILKESGRTSLPDAMTVHATDEIPSASLIEQ